VRHEFESEIDKEEGEFLDSNRCFVSLFIHSVADCIVVIKIISGEGLGVIIINRIRRIISVSKIKKIILIKKN